MAIKLGRLAKAVVGNAVVWGAGWFLGAMVYLTARLMVGMAPPGIGMMDNVGMAIRIGIVGGLAGTIFSGLIRLLFKGQRLHQLNALKFAVGGAILFGIAIPGYLILANLIGGAGFLPFNLWMTDMMIGVVFGAVAAGGSVKLAQLSDRFVPGAESEMAELSEGTSVPNATQRDRAEDRVR